MNHNHDNNQSSLAIATDADNVWQAMRHEALAASRQQPLMASFFHHNILNHSHFASAVSFYLPNLLASDAVPAMMMRDIFQHAMAEDHTLQENMLQDLLAHYTRDAACTEYITPLLYFKGYQAIQSYRIANHLWHQGRRLLAIYFQSRMAELFDVDIHPAATIDGGLMVDHATGVVIGETTVIEKNVSMLHAVTLGGSGAWGGQRHPRIGQGALLSAGAKVLGNITIGKGVKVGAGSLVLQSVPAYSTVVGVPAKVVGQAVDDMPALNMNHQLDTE